MVLCAVLLDSPLRRLHAVRAAKAWAGAKDAASVRRAPQHKREPQKQSKLSIKSRRSKRMVWAASGHVTQDFMFFHDLIHDGRGDAHNSVASFQMSSTRDAPTDDKVTTANRPSFRKLADTQSDFIQPSLACIKPVQVANVEKPNHRVLLLEDSHDDEATMKAKAPIARITLNDCLACAGCITSAESVLITQQSIEEFESMLRASGSKYDLVIVSVSAAARAAIAEHSGLSLRETHSRMAGFLKGLGVHTMLDCGTASNLGLVEQAAEFVARYRVHAAASSPATGGSPMQLVPPPPPSTAFGQGALAAPTALPVRSGAASEATSEAASPIASLAALSAASTSQLPLPLITSSCPGWVCYAEKLCGELVLSHMSSVKSAQQIAGTFRHMSSVT